MSELYDELKEITSIKSLDKRLEKVVEFEKTLDTYETKAKEIEKQEVKYKQLEEERNSLQKDVDEWKQKYSDRFFDVSTKNQQPEPQETKKGYSRLFK